MSRSARHLSRVAKALGFAVLTGLVALAGFGAGLLRAPFPGDAAAPRSGEAFLVASDGTVFARLPPTEVSIPVTDVRAQVSDCARQAVISAEDGRSYSHGGVDPLAIARAAASDVSGGATSGASTLTQQYVKNVYTNRERTLLRKAREAALAVRLDRAKSKDEILRLYLNSVYFGNSAYGIQAAARFYFDKDAAALTCGEGSVLAGLISRPSANNPVASFANAKARQRYVLDRMVSDGHRTPTQASADLESITPRSIVARRPTNAATDFPEYADRVAAAYRGAVGPDAQKDGDGLVRTPLDLGLQRAASTALASMLPPDDPSLPEAALIALDPRSGDVRALATRRDGGYQRFGLDLATDMARSSGSTTKPFTLAAALQAKTVTLDEGTYGPVRISVQVPGCASFPVRNAGDEESGASTYRTAMAHSVNTVYAPLAAEVGLGRLKALAVAAGLPASGFRGDGGKGRCPVYPPQASPAPPGASAPPAGAGAGAGSPATPTGRP